jgi:SAM-dependent methyltransferase
LSYPLIRGKFDNVQTLRAIFDKEEGCENFMTRIYPQQRRLVIAYIAEAFDKLGCRLQDLAVGSPVVVRGVLPKHAQVLDALYEILEDSGLVERDNGGRATRSHRPVELTPSVTLHEEIIRVSPQHKGTHELLQVTASQLADCLTGEVNPMHLVFGLNRSLIQDFYTHAPMFASASRHLGEFLKQTYAAALIAETERRPFELLEVGAGMGGTTKHVLDMLVHAGIPFRYTYTDISPSLVAAAKKRFTSESGGRGELANRMEFAVLDVTEAAIPERLLGRFHTVLSSNCVHATPDLALSTEHMRRMLRPNGFIALVELTTPRLYWLDLVFGFFDGWWSFADGRRHALAGMGFWETSLRKAGFGDVLWLDETKIGDTLNPQLVVAFNNGSG